jgi:hypothetical protein
MSEKNNVNPDHYKIGGRDRPNETVPAGQRPIQTDQERERERWEKRERERKNEQKD